MSLLQKSYRYCMFRNGSYLGDLPNVTSDFILSWDINTAGTQIVVTAAVSGDTSSQGNAPITTEAGLPLTDETGNNALSTEGAPPVFGTNTDNVLFRNGNTINAYEYSSTYPNGKLMFAGYVSTWEAHFGGHDDDQITLTCLSSSSDMTNKLIGGGFSEQITQDVANASELVANILAETNGMIGQTFTPGSNYSIQKAVVKLNIDPTYGTTPGSVNCSIYVGVPGSLGALIASADVSISNTAAAATSFVFPVPVALTSGTTYSLVITPNNNYIDVSYDTAQPVGQAYIFNTMTQAWQTLTGSLTFEIWSSSNLTEITYTTTDPATILKAVIDNYHGGGGAANYATGTVVNTGLTPTYTFQTNSVLEGVQALLSLAGGSYYWYVDIATQTLYFKPASSKANYIVTKGNNLTSIIMKATLDNLINLVYFTGALVGANNLFVQYINTTSINNNNGIVGMDRIGDTNVSDTNTGLLLAENDSQQHPNEEYQTQVTISAAAMDITLPRVGDMIGFSGFGNFVDSLVLQITRLQYTPNELTLTLGTQAPRTHSTIQDIKDALLQLQQVDNPTTPTL